MNIKAFLERNETVIVSGVIVGIIDAVIGVCKGFTRMFDGPLEFISVMPQFLASSLFLFCIGYLAWSFYHYVKNERQ